MKLLLKRLIENPIDGALQFEYIMYVIESISISEFRTRLAGYLEKLRLRPGYKIRLLDRRRPVMTLANLPEGKKGSRKNTGAALLRLAALAEKVEPRDPSPDISSRIDHYLYGKL